MSAIRRGVAIAHYNRPDHLLDIIMAIKSTTPVGTKVVVCDDGSSDVLKLISATDQTGTPLIRGRNLGVAANKNRALWALRDCHFLAIIEDDLLPKEEGWFTQYEEASKLSEIHHFCRVQDKEIPETYPAFSEFMQKNSLTPVFGSSPRGDLTFITATVLNRVGGFNPLFRGTGYAHGEYSNRVYRAGLIGHPLKWLDIKEARDKFIQVGDTVGGRWDVPKDTIKSQIVRNKQIYDKLDETGYVYCPLELE